MKTLTLLAVVTSLSSFSAIAGGFPLPAGHEPILHCAPFQGAPEFMVSRKNGTYYLAAQDAGRTKVFALEIDDGDCGYSTFVARNPKDLGRFAKYAEYITVSDDSEDLENPDDAVHTRGSIRGDEERRNIRDEQECDAVGSPRVNN